MAEKLNAFIALYNKKAESELAKKTEAFEKFKNLKLEASKLTPAVDPNTGKPAEIKYGSYPTFGDYINALYTDQGLNDSLFQNTAALQFNDLEKSINSQLFKLARAPIQYRNALAIKEQGGEKYFKEIRSIIGDELVKQGPGGDLTFDFLIGANSKKSKEEKIKELYDAVGELIDRSGSSIRGPGVLSSEEFYDAIVEAGSPSPSEKKEESPINAEAAKTEGKEAGSSAINKTEGEVKAKPESPSSAITATETTEKKVESESKVVSSPEAINTSKPGESVTPEKTKKSEPTAPPAAEKTKEVEVINIGAKEIAQLEKAKVAEEKKQANIESITSKLNIKDETQKTKVQDILTRFAESREKPSPLEGVTTNVQPNLLESFESAKEKAVAIGSIGAPSPIINQTTSTESVANFTNIQETSTSTNTQALNQSTQSTESTISPTTTTINAPKTLTEKQQSIIDRYKSQMNILTPEEKKARAELEKSIKVESKGAELSSAEPVVEKNKVEFSEKIPATVAKNEFTSNQNIQNVSKSPVIQEQKPAPESNIAVTPVSQPAGGETAGAQSTAVVQDMSAIEKRLKNLEIILSSPLTVKIG